MNCDVAISHCDINRKRAFAKIIAQQSRNVAPDFFLNHFFCRHGICSFFPEKSLTWFFMRWKQRRKNAKPLMPHAFRQQKTKTYKFLYFSCSTLFKVCIYLPRILFHYFFCIYSMKPCFFPSLFKTNRKKAEKNHKDSFRLC